MAVGGLYTLRGWIEGLCTSTEAIESPLAAVTPVCFVLAESDVIDGRSGDARVILHNASSSGAECDYGETGRDWTFVESLYQKEDKGHEKNGKEECARGMRRVNRGAIEAESRKPTALRGTALRTS